MGVSWKVPVFPSGRRICTGVERTRGGEGIDSAGEHASRRAVVAGDVGVEQRPDEHAVEFPDMFGDTYPAEGHRASELLRELARSPVREAPLGEGASVGRFVVVRSIGRGGFGIVYEARDPELGRRVPVKVMRTRGAAADRVSMAVEAILRHEAETAARRNHAERRDVARIWSRRGWPHSALDARHGRDTATREGPDPCADRRTSAHSQGRDEALRCTF
jgi:hypothetical protein